MGLATMVIIAYLQLKKNEIETPRKRPRPASTTVEIVSVVMPLRDATSSLSTLVKTPGARLSLSNQQSYLYKMPLTRSFRTAAVKFSPVTPKRIFSMPCKSPIPIQMAKNLT
jgi:hypothetical protein